jgi:hypothetical protein
MIQQIIRRFQTTMAGLYDRPIGDLTGRKIVDASGCEILKFEHVEGNDRYETCTVRFPGFQSPGGILTLTLTEKNGEYVGKQITFRRDWDFAECADQVTAQHGSINFRWKTLFEGTVEVTTPSFGTYVTGSTGTVMDPTKAKEMMLMRPTVEEEMKDPIFFEIRLGGTHLLDGYSSTEEHNDWLKAKMEEAVDIGMCKEGIVFNRSKTEWGYLGEFCEKCDQPKCVWESAKEDMVAYSESLPEDSTDNVSRRNLYRQMAIRLNDGAPLGKGNRVELPGCVLLGVRHLFPSNDGKYMGHREG